MVGRCDFFTKLRGKLQTFAADQKGMILPFIAIVFIALFGFATLAMDVPRYLDLQTQLQKAADAFALAGAAELDGHPAVNGQGDAISRATSAINTLMANRNSSVFGTSAAAVTVQSIRFLSSLPTSDASPIGNANVTTDPTAARFVDVVVTPVSINTIFPATLFGAASNALATSAYAVAGFTEAVCEFTPLFICNPFEGSTTTSIYDPANIGKMIKMKQGGGGTTQYSPGNYGFLAYTGKGAKTLRESLAAVNPGTCFLQNGVDTQPGNVASASDAFNTRFDLYNNSAKGWKGNADYPPALNVRKGCLSAQADTCDEDPSKPAYCNKYTDPNYSLGQCDQPATGSLGACGLPQDSAFDPNIGIVGNGSWKLADYWTVNHNATPAAKGVAVSTPWGSCTVGTPCNLASRNTVYQYEITNNLLNDKSRGLPLHKPAIPGEGGAPQCSKTASTSNPDRRIIYAAIIDCNAVGLKGGSATKVPVKAFARFFLTQPVGSDQTIYSEFQGVAEPNNANSVVHDLVQLYR